MQPTNGKSVVTNIEIVNINRPRYGQIKSIYTRKHCKWKCNFQQKYGELLWIIFGWMQTCWTIIVCGLKNWNIKFSWSWFSIMQSTSLIGFTNAKQYTSSCEIVGLRLFPFLMLVIVRRLLILVLNTIYLWFDWALWPCYIIFSPMISLNSPSIQNCSTFLMDIRMFWNWFHVYT